MCKTCERGASGRHGEPVLKEQFRSGIGPDGEPAYVLFRCSECGCLWNRRLGEDGAFLWTLKASCTRGD